MSNPIPLSTDSNAGHLVEPPVVDSVLQDHQRNMWDISFVPEESVSSREKELVSIPIGSPEGRRIVLRMDRLSRLLGQSIARVIHGGDGNFVFFTATGGRIELADPHGEIDLSLRAYLELADIAMTAQLSFLSQLRPATT